MSTGTPATPPSFLPAHSADTLGVASLLGLSIRRRGGRRSLTAVISLLVVAAMSMLAFPSFTDVVAHQRQVQVIKRFSEPQFKTTYRDGKVAIGEGLTQLQIDNPRVKVNVLVVEGTTVAALRAGAGHYNDPMTPYPCTAGNVGIAGHRTTYGRPFNRLNYMLPGDTVKLTTPISQCVYQVVLPSQVVIPGGVAANPFRVLPTVQDVVSQAGSLGTGNWLTLTSCDPPGSDARRIVLRLSMISCKGAHCPKGENT